MTQGPSDYVPPTEADIRQLVGKLAEQRHQYKREGEQANEMGRRWGHTIARQLTYEQYLKLSKGPFNDPEKTIRVMLGPSMDAADALWECTKPANAVRTPHWKPPSEHYLEEWAKGFAEGVEDVRGQVAQSGEV